VDTITTDDGRGCRDRPPAKSTIRGLHYKDETVPVPPAKTRRGRAADRDILNPRTTDAVIELVYERFYKELGAHFGKTILGIFTDGPNRSAASRKSTCCRQGRRRRARQPPARLRLPPHLAASWSKSEETTRYRDDYHRAIRMRLEETWYAPLSAWCANKERRPLRPPGRCDEIARVRRIDASGPRPIRVEANGDALRVRLVEKGDDLYALLFNESGHAPASFTIDADAGGA
jgi:hypothetical protein